VNEPLRVALARAGERLRAAGIESARLDARVLLAKSLDVAPEALFACDGAAPEQLKLFDALVARRVCREPLAYITGHKEFWSLDFAVGPGVLIPRPESETLLDEALAAFPDSPFRVLDIGTGSGCLLISFLAHRTRASGIGIDSSETALGYARKNKTRHRIDERCQFFQADWEPPVEGTFDVILVNPPYLTEREFDLSQPEIREHEPREAFEAGADGLDAIRAIAPILARRLSSAGRAFIEIGAGQDDKARAILSACHLDVYQSAPDLCGVARCLVTGWPEQGA
jgi:release factor glutamine methyltransferase